MLLLSKCVVSINGGSQLEELVRCKQIDNCADVFTVFLTREEKCNTTHIVSRWFNAWKS